LKLVTGVPSLVGRWWGEAFCGWLPVGGGSTHESYLDQATMLPADYIHSIRSHQINQTKDKRRQGKETETSNEKALDCNALQKTSQIGIIRGSGRNLPAPKPAFNVSNLLLGFLLLGLVVIGLGLEIYVEHPFQLLRLLWNPR
jgi:hypothetical protein